MLGLRYAGEKLRELDERYAQLVGNVAATDVGRHVIAGLGLQENPYVAGMHMPMSALNQIRNDVSTAPLTAVERNEVLRDTLAAELGAQGRYGIPAAAAGGVYGAGVGINAMMNNGTQMPGDPEIGPGDTLLDGSPRPENMSSQHVEAVKAMLADGQISEARAMEMLS